MRILSIETSCDDTGITLMEATGGLKSPSFKILADELASQKIHTEYGGVYPMLAKREHIKNLPILLEKVLKKAKVEKPDVIAVTYGPGLEPSLWTGIVLAEELKKKWGVPVVPVNHMEGHILGVFGKNKGKFKISKVKFPILALLVSGGHTELVLIKSWGKYEVVGKTVDDAAGEAFDKVARMLGLPYPGGPHISKLAEGGRGLLLKNTKKTSKKIAYPEKIGFPVTLPRPMIKSKDLNFSFSGLKTAVLYLIRKIGPLDEKTKKMIAAEFENAVVESLMSKTLKAKEKYKAKTLILGGGVAANKHLRKQLNKSLKKDTAVLFPTRELARDNSIMIGMAGYLNYLKNPKKKYKIRAKGGLEL